MDASKLHPTPLPYTQVCTRAHTHTQLLYYPSHATLSENANIAAYKQIVSHPALFLTVGQINISQREPSGEKQKGKQVWEEWVQFLLERCSDRLAELRLGTPADFHLYPPTELQVRPGERKATAGAPIEEGAPSDFFPSPRLIGGRADF